MATKKEKVDDINKALKRVKSTWRLKRKDE